MSLRLEHVVAIICALAGYAIVSAALAYRNKRVSSEREAAEGAWRAGAERTSSDRDHYSPEDQSQQKADAQPEQKQSNWFDVLGVSPLASVEEIKSAYRAKIIGYHPDKVATLAAELRLIAEQRSKEINEAYATALRLRQ